MPDCGADSGPDGRRQTSSPRETLDSVSMVRLSRSVNYLTVSIFSRGAADELNCVRRIATYFVRSLSKQTKSLSFCNIYRLSHAAAFPTVISSSRRAVPISVIDWRQQSDRHYLAQIMNCRLASTDLFSPFAAALFGLWQHCVLAARIVPHTPPRGECHRMGPIGRHSMPS